MLEIKNLVKIYKTKGGQEVRALDDVSVKFPETGMVFLLGKSGSGKSTLLNVSGGLDKPDSGEIIIKGKNSKEFSGADFDSYRNTFIGFIFQEYNILNEFNIEQNIELALQLQGKKNDKEAVDAILNQVDLKDMAKRKPMTLSGGQKQRVAIARALIKNPEIIMADEPTGALDSNTGKQVFDTLKKLSETKLVIIVSHDRDFAEIYADRIIELADGKIISDTTKEHIEPKQLSDNINVINDNVVSIKNVEELKKDDMDKIYDLLKSQKGEVLISSNENNLRNIKQAIHINSDNKSEVFKDTKDVEVKEYNGKDTKFIKSHLPFNRAFRIGASSIKTKPIRMIFTVFLTLVALVMFGVTSTLMLYDENYSIMEALKTSENNYEQIEKKYKGTIEYHEFDIKTGEDKNRSKDKVSYYNTYFSDSDINSLNNNNANLKFAGVFNFNSYGNVLSFENTSTGNNTFYGFKEIYGLIDAGEDYMKQNNFTAIAGSYPKNYNEIAISKYMYEILKGSKSLNISSENDVIGKEFNTSIRSNRNNITEKLKITGIYDVGNVGNSNSNFEILKNEKPDMDPTELDLLKGRFNSYMMKSYHLIGYVDKSFYDHYNGILQPRKNSSSGDGYVNSIYSKGLRISETPINESVNEDYGSDCFSSNLANILKNNIKVYSIDGKEKTFTMPNTNQIYISYDEYMNIRARANDEKLNYLRDLLSNNYYKLSEKSNDDFSDKDTREALINKYSKGSYALSDEDIAYIDTFISTYSELIKNVYILNTSNTYINQFYSEEKTVDDAFNEFNNHYQQMYNYIYSDEAFDKSFVDENINYINNYLSQDENKTVLEHALNLNAIYQKMYNYDKSTIERIQNITNKSIKEITEEEYDYLKSLVNATYDPNNIVIGRNNNNVKYYYKNSNGLSGELELLGYYTMGDSSSYSPRFMVNDDFLVSNAKLDTTKVYYSIVNSDYQKTDDSKYYTLITKTNYSQAEVDVLLKDSGSFRYEMTNASYISLKFVIEMITTLKTVFLIVGVVFAVFAALMLFNFISSSISSKTKEIGILRAVGARGSDLFKIFFSESGLLSIICAILSIIISIVVCYFLNKNLAEAMTIKLLNFGFINILLIVVGATLLAFIGTFIPVFIASKKQPVDSIRTL